MLSPSLQTAAEHYRRQQRITAAGLAAARRARLGPLNLLLAIMVAFRITAAEQGAASVPLMLDEQNVTADPEFDVAPESFAASASDGRSLASLLEATRRQPASFDLVAMTQIQDAGRTGASLAVAARPDVTGYTRMLNLPSCSRCIVLAGATYEWSEGFDRHPRCDCRHIPSVEDTAGDLTTDPRAAFDSMPTAADLSDLYPDLTVKQRRARGLVSQEDAFTVAGARAIREGADIGQVVNARAGMQTAQVFGRDVLATTANRQRPGIRLMPESIFALADDRADALRLLRLHGYVK